MVLAIAEDSSVLMAGPKQKGYCLNQITCYTGLRLIIMCITASSLSHGSKVTLPAPQLEEKQNPSTCRKQDYSDL